MRVPPPRRSVFLFAFIVLITACGPRSSAADVAPPQDQVLGSSPDDKQVHVRVVDPSGQPVPGVKLWFELDHKDFPAIREGDPRRMAIIYTKGDGVASMWYPPKPAACVVTAKGYAAQFLRNVELTKQDPFVIHLSRGKTIRGRITRPGGAPPAGVEVVATPKMTMAATTSLPSRA